MGKKDKKGDSKPSNSAKGNNTNNQSKPAEPEKKAKGHKQKGAGTVIVSKGEVTVGGVVMKEWQRTPLQLVNEYCQRQKRPKPQLLNMHAPPGKFVVKVILPDPKDKERDLVFASADSFPDLILARNCTCLLALHHLQPTLPLHQKLPEPYASMWLKLTGMREAPKKESEAPKFVCPVCKKGFEKELGLKTHLNKEHGLKKMPVEEEDQSASASSTPRSPAASDVSPAVEPTATKLQSDIKASSTPKSPATPKSPSTPKLTTSSQASHTAKQAPPRVVDHRDNKELQEISLESKNRYISKYDRIMAEEKHRIDHARHAKQMELKKQLLKPPRVILSEQNQQFILDLLKEQNFSLNQFDQHSVLADFEKDQLRKKLIDLGFQASDVEKSLEHGSSLEACIDWLCMNLKDEQLPKRFQAAGKQMEVKVSVSESSFSWDDLLTLAGFEGFTTKDSFELNLIDALRSIMPTFKEMNDDSVMDEVNQELEALKFIYNVDEENPVMLIIEKENVLCVRLPIDSGYLVFCFSQRLGYPKQSPIALLCVSTLASEIRREFTRHIFSQFSQNCSSVLYDIISDVNTFIEKAKLAAPKVQQLKPIKEKAPIRSKPHRYSPNPQPRFTSRSRVIDKSTLFGKPSPSIQKQRASLPIVQYKKQVLEMLRTNQVSIVSGGTGCGKSTQVPQFLIEEFRENNEKDLNIIVCEPRRISCLGLCSRVIEEQGFVAGDKCPIGYQVRGDSKTNQSTILTYCTTGVLLRQLQSGEPLGVTHIIVDEIHERSILSDFLLFLLRCLIQHNKTLKIILMSATLNETLFSTYFGGVPSVCVEGRVFPVTEKYLDDIIFDTHYMPSQFHKVSNGPVEFSTDMEKMIDQWSEKYQDFGLIPHVIRSIFESEKPWSGGVILVFLSGAAEIKNASFLINEAFNNSPLHVEVIACHGSLSTDEQKRVFENSQSGYRVVLSTNIAETSITIPNCRFVIDTGREKRVVFNADSNISEMKEVWISRASAEQRKGRAGRVRSGVVYRLFTRSKFQSMESYTPPEMLRSPLDSICLQVLRMKIGNPQEVLAGCISPPSGDSVKRALEVLQEIQAVQFVRGKPELTPLGNNLADLPLDCRLGKMVIFGCLLRCVDSAVTIAAFLSQRSVFRAPLEKRDEMMACKRKFVYRFSDHLTLLRVFDEWRSSSNRREFCYQNFINYESMLTVSSLQRQFVDELINIHFLPRGYKMGDPQFNMNGREENVLKAVLTAGLYANVIKVEKTKIKFSKTIEGGAFETTPQAKEYRLLIQREVKEAECRDGLTRVYIHPSSINFSEREYQYPFMVYTTMMNTSKLFVHDSTVVTPYAILLFGGPIQIQHFEGTISVDKWLRFTTPARVGVLINGLRGYISQKLQEKFEDPEESIEDDPVMNGICKLLISNGV